MVCLELKSPPPPNTLSIRPGGGEPLDCAEVSLLMHVLTHLGIAAPDTCERGASAMMHCHVNVCNLDAPGRSLDYREILAVWQAWVAYEFVTVKFARSWQWRDRWAAPLYATGAEFVFQQKPWEQGRVLHTAQLFSNDVPAFVRHCHAMVRSERFTNCRGEEERLALLFDPRRTPGKHVSLNVNHVTTLGTVEFRRMHSTTSGRSVTRWLHFCASFVEAFGDDGAPRAPHFLDAPDAETALRWLEEAQHSATLTMLETDMGLAAGQLDHLSSESCLVE
jgi:hypothetical protein